MSAEPNDPALTEPLSRLFERNDARPLPRAKSTKRETPHGRLKKACREALKREFTGGFGMLIPIANLPAQIPGTDRVYRTGRKGAADDLWLYRPQGLSIGLCIAIEYKAGDDEQRPSQETFEMKWNRAGGFYTIARDPASLVDTVKALIGEVAARDRQGPR